MEKILFLESVMKEKLYGSNRIQKKFGFGPMDKKIGEYWCISAHDNGLSAIANGEFEGYTLKDVYEKHRELFAEDTHEKFPLLIKINEVQEPVSVQVHPDDAYAKKYENDSGKAEFCLWLDVEEGTHIIRGHTAKTKEEFRKAIENKEWDTLFIRKPIHKDGFVYTPSGTVHGIEGKLMMAEVQQSSDATYRIYDYERKDDNGNTRQLHIDKACDVTTIPYVEDEIKEKVYKESGNTIIEYVDGPYFKVTRYQIQNHMILENPGYCMCVPLSGNGVIVIDNKEYDVKAGIGFIVTSATRAFEVKGNIDLLVSISK
jgi:mannose-6-phosphate isomerase